MSCASMRSIMNKMTKQEAINKLVAWATAQIGYTEGSDNYNKFAPKWTAAGGWNAQNQPWCDVFVDVAFIETFGLDLASKLTYQPKGGFSALCSASANFYKANGAWFSTPQVGDQVFMNVSGGINHTGIVIGVTGGVITTVEGNASDAVRRNTYALGNSYIAGFGRPNWDIFSSNSAPSVTTGENTKPSAPITPQVKTCSVSVKLPVIEYGDASMYVKLMQTALIGRGFNCGWYGADGEYGQQTKIALYQFQQKMKLDADCVCGSATWTALLNS